MPTAADWNAVVIHTQRKNSHILLQKRTAARITQERWTEKVKTNNNVMFICVVDASRLIGREKNRQKKAESTKYM